MGLAIDQASLANWSTMPIDREIYTIDRAILCKKKIVTFLSLFCKTTQCLRHDLFIPLLSILSFFSPPLMNPARSQHTFSPFKCLSPCSAAVCQSSIPFCLPTRLIFGPGSVQSWPALWHWVGPRAGERQRILWRDQPKKAETGLTQMRWATPTTASNSTPRMSNGAAKSLCVHSRAITTTPRPNFMLLKSQFTPDSSSGPGDAWKGDSSFGIRSLETILKDK